MPRRRAVKKEDKMANPERLPLLYKSLTPLTPDLHSGLRIKGERDYQVAARENVIPLTADEFPIAMRDYPIVFASQEMPTPVALVGFERGKNEQLDSDGNWQSKKYVPAYLRRFPFALVKETNESERAVLCADLSSVMFTEDPSHGKPLFEDGKSSPVIERAIELCQRYAKAAARTRAFMQRAADLDLIGPSSVTVTRGETKRVVEGFSIFSEEKLRALDDKTLAALTREGVYNLIAAHQFSLANFSSLSEA